MGVWRRARLIKDWDDVSKSTGAALSSQELFFNVCFAVLLGGTRMQFQGDFDFMSFSKRFLGVWALISSAADYATRFNDDDLYHKIWWTGYGAGLVGMVMHLKGSENVWRLHAALALTNAWIAIAFFRVGATLPRCRLFCLYFGIALLGGTFSWQHETTRDWGLPSMISPVASILFVAMIPKSSDVPINIEYHVAKFTGIKMLLMGQPVVALAVTPSASADHELYLLALLGLALVVSIKLLIFDCDVVPVENHAIRHCKRSALVWLHFCQPALALAITATAAGLGGVLDAKNNNSVSAASRPAMLLNRSVAALLSALAITQWQHRQTFTNPAALALLAGGILLAAWAQSEPSVDMAVAVPCAVCWSLVLVLFIDRERQMDETDQEGSEPPRTKSD